MIWQRSKGFLFKGILACFGLFFFECRFVPIQGFGSVPTGPIIFHIIIVRYRPLEESGFSRHEVFILDDGGGDEDDQIAFLALLGFAAKRVTEQWNVPENGNFGILVSHI